MIDGNEIWEALFSIMEGDVPDEMTEFFLSLWHQTEWYHFLLLYVSVLIAWMFVCSYTNQNEDAFFFGIFWPVTIPIGAVVVFFAGVIEAAKKASKK